MAKKKIPPPDDFDSAEAFLEHARSEFRLDLEADKHNRDAALDDLKFFVGDQWPSEVLSRRRAANKPCLVENFLPAFVGQVTGNRRLNDTQIKVLPDKGGTKAQAALREGLLRSIQKVSHADVAYNMASQNQAICGIGNFQIVIEEAKNDVFLRDLRIKPISNSMSVVWDRMSVEPTGEDATHVFVVDKITNKVFASAYPDAAKSDLSADTNLMGDLRNEGWIEHDTVRVASYWRLRKRPATFALFTDDSTHKLKPEQLDADKQPLPEVLAQIATGADGQPMVREGTCTYAELYVISGTDILDGPQVLEVSSVPVFRVPGWEVSVGEERHRWGVVRFMKDPQRGHNYWRSVITEKLMMAPKAKWIAADTAVQGIEKQYREAHLSDDPLLTYKAESGAPPTLVPPAQFEQALVLESNTSLQTMRDISNIHEATLGQQSNEVSGKAIIARQRVGELGTVLYQDNENLAIERCGRVLNELIPIVYDTPRIVMVIGEDDKEALVGINNPDDPLTDTTSGKYHSTITTGPSYVTRRIEAAEGMQNFINAAPQIFTLVADLVAESQDWPKAQEFSRRLRQALPPGTLAPEDMTQEQQQAQQAQQQSEAQVAQLALTKAKAEADKAVAEVAEVEARTQLALAQAERARGEVKIKAASENVKAASTQFNDHMKAIEVAEGGSDDKQGAK